MTRPRHPMHPLVLLAVLPALAAPAAAFDSFPWGAPHDRITRRALAAAGFTDDRAGECVREVRDADWKQAAWRPSPDPRTWARIGTNADYRAAYHFDRGVGTSHAQAFLAGGQFVRGCRDLAIRAAAAGDDAEAVRHLGRGLHAVQDLLSHSNYVDLPREEQAVIRHLVFEDEGFGDGVEREAVSADATPGDTPAVGATPVPPTLQMTGYDPGARDPERPPDDPYPHGEFAKDGAKKNAESRARLADDRTKYEAAFEVAVEFSALFLAEIRGALTPDAWDRLRGLR